MAKTMKSNCKANNSNRTLPYAHETGKHYTFKQCCQLYRQITGLSVPDKIDPWDMLHAVMSQCCIDRVEAIRAKTEHAHVVKQQEVNKKQIEALGALLDAVSVSGWLEILDELLDILISALHHMDGERLERSMYAVRELQRFVVRLRSFD